MTMLENITGTRKFYAPILGGGGFRVKVKKKMWDPGGREVSGVLRIGSQEIFPPKVGAIVIGSARGCNIRIKDPADLKTIYAVLTFNGTGEFRISKLPLARVMIENNKGEQREVRTDGAPAEGVPLSDVGRIFLPLDSRGKGGTARYLEIGVEMDEPRDMVEDIREALGFRERSLSEPAPDRSPGMSGALAPIVSLPEARQAEEKIDGFLAGRNTLVRGANKIERRGIWACAATVLPAFFQGLLFLCGKAFHFTSWLKAYDSLPDFLMIYVSTQGLTALLDIRAARKTKRHDEQGGLTLAALRENDLVRVMKKRGVGDRWAVIKVLRQVNAALADRIAEKARPKKEPPPAEEET